MELGRRAPRIRRRTERNGGEQRAGKDRIEQRALLRLQGDGVSQQVQQAEDSLVYSPVHADGAMSSSGEDFLPLRFFMR